MPFKAGAEDSVELGAGKENMLQPVQQKVPHGSPSEDPFRGARDGRGHEAESVRGVRQGLLPSRRPYPPHAGPRLQGELTTTRGVLLTLNLRLSSTTCGCGRLGGGLGGVFRRPRILISRTPKYSLELTVSLALAAPIRPL
jgi:hypothetical protein